MGEVSGILLVDLLSNLSLEPYRDSCHHLERMRPLDKLEVP